jgi:hypothetical protein
MTASVEDLRRAVLGDMRQAHEIAELARRGTDEMHCNLARWKAEGRLFSVEHEGAEYFPVYALDPGSGYRPYPVVGDVVCILSKTVGWGNEWGVAYWFMGLNSFLDDQRPQDLLSSDLDWVIDAARDAVETEKA